jgi:hypothetical protein
MWTRERTTKPTCVMSLLVTVVLTNAIAPSFDAFTSRAVASQWRGACYTWTRGADEGATALAVATGFVTEPTACTAEVTEVMRSCGGAVQGVKETREGGAGVGLTLNRADDGFLYFDGELACPSRLRCLACLSI